MHLQRPWPRLEKGSKRLRSLPERLLAPDRRPSPQRLCHRPALAMRPPAHPCRASSLGDRAVDSRIVRRKRLLHAGRNRRSHPMRPTKARRWKRRLQQGPIRSASILDRIETDPSSRPPDRPFQARCRSRPARLPSPLDRPIAQLPAPEPGARREHPKGRPMRAQPTQMPPRRRAIPQHHRPERRRRLQHPAGLP